MVTQLGMAEELGPEYFGGYAKAAPGGQVYGSWACWASG